MRTGRPKKDVCVGSQYASLRTHPWRLCGSPGPAEIKAISAQFKFPQLAMDWGRKEEKARGKPTVVAILSDSIVYHVVTTEHAAAGTSSKAPGEALSGQTLWERCGKFPVRAHVSSIVTDG